MGSDRDSGTRERVRLVVGRSGPVTAAAIASELGLTAAAVRRHLDALAEDGEVTEREVVEVGGRRRGRPARAYVLAEAGHGSLGDAYPEVAADALRFLAEAGGPGAVQEFARRRAERLREQYQDVLDAAGPDVEDRTEALAQALAGDGYVASVRSVQQGEAPQGVQLCQGHCPVQHVAEEFPELCEAETEAFAEMLGVHVQRLATLADGHHVCTTFVPAHALSRERGQPAPDPTAAATADTDQTTKSQNTVNAEESST